MNWDTIREYISSRDKDNINLAILLIKEEKDSTTVSNIRLLNKKDLVMFVDYLFEVGEIDDARYWNCHYVNIVLHWYNKFK